MSWWHLDAVSNLIIIGAFLCLAVLIIVPIVWARQLRSRLAVATAELEAFQAESAARDAAEEERDFAVYLMDAINEHSATLISLKDLEGRYLMVNRAYEQNIGVPAADLIGHTYAVVDPAQAELVHALDRADVG